MGCVVVQLGQGGNQMASAFFNALASLSHPATASQDFFRDSSTGEHIARAVLIDMEPKVVAAAMKRPCGSPLSNPASWSYSQNRQVICDSGSGNNWARGFYVHGPRCRDSILDIVRLEVEECDRFGGFVTMQSMGGGTGSGLGTYISEALRDEYPSTCILSNCIWPHESGEVIVQSYNVLLTLSYLESLADGIVILQNEGLTSICKKLLGIQRPSFHHMNEVAAESLVSVLLPAFWRPVEATLSPPKENTHRLTHPIIQTGDNKPNNSGKFVASSHLHLLSDLVSVLCAHPAYRLLSLRFTPQVPPQSLDFTTFTWGAHMKQLRHMLTMGAWGDTDFNWSAALSTIASSTSKVSSQPGLHPTNRSVANLLILRGNGSQHADVNTFAHESLYPIWSVDPLNVAVNEIKLGNYEMAAGLLSNCQSTVMPASRVLPEHMACTQHVHIYTNILSMVKLKLVKKLAKLDVG